MSALSPKQATNTDSEAPGEDTYPPVYLYQHAAATYNIPPPQMFAPCLPPQSSSSSIALSGPDMNMPCYSNPWLQVAQFDAGSINDTDAPTDLTNFNSQMLATDQGLGSAGGLFGSLHSIQEDLSPDYLHFRPGQWLDLSPHGRQDVGARSDGSGPSFTSDLHGPPGVEYPTLQTESTRRRQSAAFSQRIVSLDKVSSYYFKLNQSRQELLAAQQQARSTSQTSGVRSTREADELITSIFRAVLNFCENILASFNASKGTDEGELMADTYAMITITVMTINSIVDIHHLILTDCEESTRASASRSSSSTAGEVTPIPMQGITRPVLALHRLSSDRSGQQRPSPALASSPRDQMFASSSEDIGPRQQTPRVGAWSSQQSRSSFSSADSSNRNPSPLAKADATDPALTLIMRLDTMDFNAAHLQAMCRSMQHAAERLASTATNAATGLRENMGIMPGPNTTAKYREPSEMELTLPQEIDHTLTRITLLQQNLGRLSRKLKRPAADIEGLSNDNGGTNLGATEC